MQDSKERYRRFKKRNLNWKEIIKNYSEKARKKTKNIFIRYRLNAKDRNIYFNLSLEDFEEMKENNNCSYCGDKLDKIGIDRVNNKIGYIKENIVPCCATCNYMKGKMNKDLFLKQCKKIIINN